jgi:hypothetical protein
VKTGADAWSPASDGALLRRGSQLRVTRGEAELAQASGVVLHLRAGGELALARTPALTTGHLLVETKRSAATIDVGGSSFSVATNSAVRLHRSLGADVGVYSGHVDLRSAGRRLRVPALRAAGIPAPGLVPARPSPLRLDPADAWDARLVGRAFDLTEQLDAGSAGFTAQAPNIDATLLFGLLPGVPANTPARLSTRRPGDQLVGAAIASVVSKSAVLDARMFDARINAVLDFYDDGASWGLVVLDQAGAQQDEVVAVVRAAIGRWASRMGGLGTTAVAPAASPEPDAVVVASPPAAPAPSAAPVPGGPVASPPTPAPTPPPVGLPTPTTPPVTTPQPTIPVPPTGTPLDDVLDVISGVVVTPPPLPALGRVG